MRYVQPFFSYNRFKWDELIEPKEYEKGKRKYIESMERITLAAVSTYFQLVKAADIYESAKVNYENTVLMLSVASQRIVQIKNIEKAVAAGIVDSKRVSRKQKSVIYKISTVSQSVSRH